MRQRNLVLVLYVLSGACALIYEVVYGDPYIVSHVAVSLIGAHLIVGFR